MLDQGSIFVFINFEQAARFGHIGWGFQLEEPGRYLFGSSDHLYRHHVLNLPGWLNYMAVPPGSDIDWWCHNGSESEMLTTMASGRHSASGRHLSYHAYKAIGVSKADPLKARHTAESQAKGGWHLMNNNCVHQTYQILADYGAAAVLPHPDSTPLRRIPKTWFAMLDGVTQLLPK